MYQRYALTITLSNSDFVLLDVVAMDETTQIKAILNRFGCRRHPKVELLTVGLGFKSTKSIMTMDKPVIKDINNGLEYLLDPSGTAADRVECGLQTMQAIEFLSR